MKPGISVAQAQSEANVLFPQLRETLKLDGDTDYKTTATGLKEFVSGKLRRSLQVLWGAVALILLIVCVNLSNLLLARAAMRSKEFALRVALGAGRGRLVRQLVTESLVLSGAGALLGLGFAYAANFYLAPGIACFAVDEPRASRRNCAGMDGYACPGRRTTFRSDAGVEDVCRKSAGVAEGLEPGNEDRPQA